VTFTGEDDVIDTADPAQAAGPVPSPARIARFRRPAWPRPAVTRTPQPQPHPTPTPTPTPRASDGTFRSAGIAITLLAVAILGFVGYLYVLSGVQEARAQTTLYARLQGELGQGIAPAGPQAPTGPDGAMQPVKPGDPMGLLSIPSIGIRNMVIVYGTSPEDLTRGPGLLRDSSLPGQAGISVIFGRRAAFGAPFASLPQLRPGASITAVTSQGTATYQVVGVASSRKAVPFRSYANQLLLVTADSRIAPAHYVEVEARLVTTAQPTPSVLPAIGPSEAALGRDASALIPAMAWAIALAAAAALGTVLASRWSRWPAWIATIPVIIAILWNLYQCLTALLPNVY
jgi:sortase A